MGNQCKSSAKPQDASLMTDDTANTNMPIIKHAGNDATHLVLNRQGVNVFNPFFIRPDLRKLIMVGNAGGSNHKPFYLIYDIRTGLQIEKRIEVDHPEPLKGRYCYGYFDKTDYGIFIFCIGPSAKKIFYIDTITGEYTKKLVNPDGEFENPYINEVMYMDYLNFNEKELGKDYSVETFSDERRRIYDVDVSYHRLIFYRFQMPGPITSYFMRQRLHCTYLTLIYGLFRCTEDVNDNRIFPQDIAKCINNYIDGDTRDLYFITESTTDLRISKILCRNVRDMLVGSPGFDWEIP